MSLDRSKKTTKSYVEKESYIFNKYEIGYFQMRLSKGFSNQISIVNTMFCSKCLNITFFILKNVRFQGLKSLQILLEIWSKLLSIIHSKLYVLAIKLLFFEIFRRRKIIQKNRYKEKAETA